MNDKYSAQVHAYLDSMSGLAVKSTTTARVFRDGVWHDYDLAPTVPTLTFEEYVLTGTGPSKRDPEKDEITCPVCSCAGKEQVLDDRVRIYHPTRLIPCRAPEGYELQGAEGDRPVPA